MIDYPNLKHCATTEELCAVVDDCRTALGIGERLPAWPGAWGQLSNSLRWKSCEMEGELAEATLLMANLLMDGEVRHMEIMRDLRSRQDMATEQAMHWLEGWIDGCNAAFEELARSAADHDELTTLELAIDYARIYPKADRPWHYNAMRTAIRLAFGLWVVEVDDLEVIVTGSRLKSLAGATNHATAADKLGARRI